MEGDLIKCNRNLHCQYHYEQGHTTKNCRTLWSHLEQLVREGKLKQFLYQLSGQRGQAGLGSRRDASLRVPLGTINVILAVPGRIGSHPSRVLSIARSRVEDSTPELKRAKIEVRPALSFLDKDKVGTI